MRFLVKFVLLVSVRKEIDFFTMYDEGFLIIRTNSLEGALAYLKGGAPIDAVIVEKAQDARPVQRHQAVQAERQTSSH